MDNVATPTGSTTSTPAGDTGSKTPGQVTSSAPVSTPASEPFYSHKFDDGQEMKFASREELDRHFHDGYLRHSDYTKKTQALAEERKKWEQERDGFLGEHKDKLSAYEKFEKAYQLLTPEQKNQATRIFQGVQLEPGEKIPPAVAKVLEEQAKQIKSYGERFQAEDQAKEREAVYSRAVQKYPDLDRKAIEDTIRSVQEAPPGEGLYALVEMVYHSLKGRNPTSEPGISKPFNPASGPKGNQKEKVFSSIAEAKAAAVRAARS